MKRLLPLVAIVPLVAATVAAGVIASPSKERPCVTGFSEGFKGGPTHVDLGPDGALWATEGQDDKIARFDPKTGRAQEFELPKDTEPHDLAIGPGDDLWFSRFNGGIGRFDPDSKQAKVYTRKSPGAQPHVWWAKDGRGYYGDLITGNITIFDPEDESFEVTDFNLPPRSGPHSFFEMPDGNAWWALQNSDQLAHFDLEEQRFDRFVDLPRDSGPHWIVEGKKGELWIAQLYANELVRFDPESGRTKRFDIGLDPISEQDVKDRKPLPAIAQVHRDAQGEALWVTTLAGGEVRRFDLDSHEVTRVGCGLKFPAQITTMTNDREGNLWVTEGPPATSGAGRLGRIER